jgi:hypothetical protein
MHRLLWFLLMPALLLGTVAQAQVAAPELTPVAFHNFLVGLLGHSGATITPDNPAALQWSDGSLVGAGEFNQSTSNGQTFRGKFVGFRGVGDRLGIAADVTRADQTDAPVGKEYTNTTQLSLRLVGGLALGIGFDKGTAEAPTQTLAGKTFGFSADLGKNFYVGAAAGRETEGGTASGDRSKRMYGIAWRPQGAWRWHLALDHVATGETGALLPGFKTDTATVQAAVGAWLLGVSQSRMEWPAFGISGTIHTYDLGWVPEKGGLAVTLRRIATDTNTGVTVALNSLAVSYLF